MPLPVSQVGNIHVVSVHDEEEPLHFSIPGVTPSRYDIPGINASKEVFDSCKFSFPDGKTVKYAVKRTFNHHPYVLITIVEPHTFIYGSEQQKLDEYNRILAPDIQRIPVPVRMELVANEIERQCGQLGLEAVGGDVTMEVINRLEAKSVQFMRNTVSDTSRLAKRSAANVTPQARRRAWRLHKMGLLNPLPEWADVNPGAETNALTMFNCRNCSKQLRTGVTRCECGVIYNWRQAVEDGLVKPSDVPLSKRAEAGLIEAADDTRDSTGPAPGKSPVRDPNDEDDAGDAFKSLNASDLPPIETVSEEELQKTEEAEVEEFEGEEVGEEK